MPNNEIERIAEKYALEIYNWCDAHAEIIPAPHFYAEKVVAALSEMRTVALREAAEIDLGADVQGITDWGKGYKQAVRDYAAAILGRIDK